MRRPVTDVRADLREAEEKLAQWEARLQEARDLVGEGHWFRRLVRAKKTVSYWRGRLARLQRMDEEGGVDLDEGDDPEPLFDYSRVLMPWRVGKGARAWAPWGETGWSAVIVRGRPGRVWVPVHRVDPRTDEIKSRGKVRLDELVSRDPEKKGKDRPEVQASIALAQVRAVRSEVEARAKGLGIPARIADPLLTEEQKARRVERLMDMCSDDQSTTEDW